MIGRRLSTDPSQTSYYQMAAPSRGTTGRGSRPRTGGERARDVERGETRILVVSPWGIGGGYSGPVTLMNRLFAEVHHQNQTASIDVIYRDRGNEVVPAWVDRAVGIRLGDRSSFSRFEQARWAGAVRLFLARHRDKYDFVHIHGAYMTNLLVLSHITMTRTKYCLLPVVEGGDLCSSARSGLSSWIKQWTVRRRVSHAAVGFALSAGIGTDLAANGLDPSKSVQLPNLVSATVFGDVDRPAPSPRSIRLGFVGKLGVKKRPDILLDALLLLKDRQVNVTACFIGPFESDSYEQEFKGKIQERGIDSYVRVLGFRDDVAQLLKSEIDVFILPSSSEGLPGALVEALMSGCPSVVTESGSMGHHIRTSGAGTVVAQSPTAVADAVWGLVEHPARWVTMSANAKAYAETVFDSQVVAQTYSQALLASAVSGHTPSNK